MKTEKIKTEHFSLIIVNKNIFWLDLYISKNFYSFALYPTGHIEHSLEFNLTDAINGDKDSFSLFLNLLKKEK